MSVDIPREQLPTKFQLRTTLGQKDVWLDAQRASGDPDLSSWIRRVCDETAAAAGFEPPPPRRARGEHDPSPRPEEPVVRTERQAPIPVSLADNCINGDYHWRLRSGERCVSCGGVA